MIFRVFEEGGQIQEVEVRVFFRLCQHDCLVNSLAILHLVDARRLDGSSDMDDQDKRRSGVFRSLMGPGFREARPPADRAGVGAGPPALRLATIGSRRQ